MRQDTLTLGALNTTPSLSLLFFDPATFCLTLLVSQPHEKVRARGPGLLPTPHPSGSLAVHVDQSHFFFNVSWVGTHEKVLRAELRVFKFYRLRRTPAHYKAQHFHSMSGAC